jgi:hypothetical protein
MRRNILIAPVLPVTLRLQLQQRFLRGKVKSVTTTRAAQQTRYWFMVCYCTCFCFIAINRRSRSSSSSSRPLRMCHPIAARERGPRSHVVEHLDLLVQSVVFLVRSLQSQGRVRRRTVQPLEGKRLLSNHQILIAKKDAANTSCTLFILCIAWNTRSSAASAKSASVMCAILCFKRSNGRTTESKRDFEKTSSVVSFYFGSHHTSSVLLPPRRLLPLRLLHRSRCSDATHSKNNRHAQAFFRTGSSSNNGTGQGI